MFSTGNIVAYALGLATFLILPGAFARVLRLFSSDAQAPRKDIYGLEHALLNAPFPPDTMWMNMGYWKNTAHFPSACRDLLLLMLEKAQIAKGHSPRSVVVWDLGFGCGDQTALLAAELERAGVRLRKYDGLTLNPAQFRYAQQRILSDVRGAAAEKKDAISLHLADASDPECWPAWTPLMEEEEEEEEDGTARWTLALDSLYHFRPSRGPVLRHVARNLGSSLLAFDLLRSPTLSPLQSLWLRAICLLTQIPYSNLLTVQEYTELLVSAGYRRSQVEVIDISQDVFPGLERFIKTRGGMVKDMGVKGGWAGFGFIGKVVGWWGREGVVRGCIVVARQ